ncbi:proline iminopeptidase [Pontibacter ummariensis]|uniref:Proline iminopeptidase n=1 Tax=Pontibacter ummariensis TaxID=1610492 RepID=A0A239CRD3_9BACT|nr:alpha/beta hydrolase [Pontibacter ummariensis]PRY14870.1 proline iminopeptidase [Pontibacter ummariensis]SNS22657.1 proline iminopeptidase [Pontibacter ummariensis]
MKKALLSFLLLLLLATATQAQQKHFYFTTSDSVQLYVRVAGQGKPCLFIHGGPGSWTKYFYALGGDVVEQDMTMIYVDQRGCGRSGSPANNDYSLARMVQDFEELREYMGYDKWILMPHSFGGTIATEYAYTQPTHVTATIYVNSTLNLNNSLESYIVEGARMLNVPASELRKPGTPVGEALGGVVGKLHEKDLMYKMMYPEKKMFEQMNAVMDTTLNWHFGSNVWNYKEYEQDFTVKSAQIKSPVLVFAGKYDYAIGPKHYKSFQFPNATYQVVDTGHCPYQEQPEEFRKHVRRFLAKLN